MDDDNRCPTGIPGLDNILGGGFPKGRVVLLAGSCGTGKSILSTQFLYRGITEYDEPGILVNLEQNPNLYKQDMISMGFDLERLEREKKLIIIDASLSCLAASDEDFLGSPGIGDQYTISKNSAFSLESIIGLIAKASEEIGAKRVVVDSFSALDSLIEARMHVSGLEPVDNAHKIMLGINYELQSMGLTSLLIVDTFDDDSVSKHGVEEFITDGVILLTSNAMLDLRTLKIIKMRGTKHTLKPVGLDFGPDGISVKSI